MDISVTVWAAKMAGLPAPDIGAPVSLAVIVGTPAVTAVASLAKVRRDRRPEPLPARQPAG